MLMPGLVRILNGLTNMWMSKGKNKFTPGARAGVLIAIFFIMWEFPHIINFNYQCVNKPFTIN